MTLPSFVGIGTVMVEALARTACLRNDLDPDEAADVAWALISPEKWQLLWCGCPW